MTKLPHHGTVAAAILLALSMTACAVPTRPHAAPQETEAPPTTTAPTPSNCLNLTAGARAKLERKIAEKVPGSAIVRTGLVSSPRSSMYMLAVEFTDPGLDRDFVGVWGSMQDLTADEDPAFVAIDDVAAASAEYLQPIDFAGTEGPLPSVEDATACLA